MPRNSELNPESSPAARFGYEVRKRRNHVHISQEELGRRIGYTGAMVSMVEIGKRLPSADFARKCDEILELDGALLRVWEMCRSDGAQQWFLPWLEVEQTATTLHTWQHSLVPGLLQSFDYAKALFLGVPGTHRAMIDNAVTSRIERQAIFDRERPPMMWAVLDEVVLMRPVGGPAVMRGQLEHLLSVAEQPHITVQIVPLPVGCTAGLGGAFVLAHAHGHDLGYLETTYNGVVTAVPENVKQLQIRYDVIRTHALPRDASHDLIKEWMQKWMS
ncbi:helix-turn-helix transcriptional regulator [Sphaerisporangium sp. NPDC051011]|uniref:helix-turn-helix domain-containing protein n=1 Tax=Sphaerisporangium sp. NPDC051011 TaxID=3155792 RepID=UPI0033FDCAF7